MDTLNENEYPNRNKIQVFKDDFDIYSLPEVIERIHKESALEFIGLHFPNFTFIKLDLSNRYISFINCFFNGEESFNCDNSTVLFNNISSMDDTVLNFLFIGSVKEIRFRRLNEKNLELKKIEAEFLRIEQSKIKTLEIYDCEIKNCEISGLFKNSKIDYFAIFSSVFGDLLLKDFIIGQSSYFEELSINKLELISIECKDLILFSLIHCTNFYIQDCILNKFSVQLLSNHNETDLEVLSLTNSSFNDFILLKKNTNYTWIDELVLDNVENVQIIRSKIKLALLGGFFNNNVEFFNSSISTLAFEKFSSSGNVYFNNIEFMGLKKLHLNNSFLDKVTLNPSFLHQLDNIFFNKSSILGMKVNSFMDLQEDCINPKKRDVSVQYLTLYRELKFLAESTKNNYLYQRFKTLEYQEILNEKSQNVNLTNRIILYLNDLSNKHGTSPFYSLGWFAVLFLLYQSILKLHFGYWEYSDWSKFLDNHYTLFINPFQYINSFSEYDFPWWLKVWDIIYNISIGYLIYQFVASFRKFNR